MSLPSSPSPSSESSDFAAFLDAELLSLSSDSNSQSSGQDNNEDDSIAEENDQDKFSERIYALSRKRKRPDNESDDSRSFPQAASDTVDGNCSNRACQGSKEMLAYSKTCPPHPGFMRGVCIRCGALRPESEPDEGGVALRYIHEGLEITQTEAERMRSNELEKLLAKKKLYLVLDLDHTLLNSARFAEVPSDEEAYLSTVYLSNKDCLSAGRSDSETGTVSQQGEEQSHCRNLSLCSLGNLQMWTKLRPFVHKFLAEASKMFEMYLYTMGERIYAQAMAQLLDPMGRFFGSRVISQSDSTRRTAKDLDIILGAESTVVILDDTEGIWPRHKANLILMERYHFFSSSCRQFGIPNASLLEAQKDESEEDGTLANTLQLLQSIHTAFFDEIYLDERGRIESHCGEQDVTKIIQNLRSKVLAGCKVVFSRIFPTALPSPESHRFWRLTEELGAVCTNSVHESVTHVVALDKGTDKARWAVQHKRHVVHPRWVEAALYTWKRPSEEDYPVGDSQNMLTFSKTVDVGYLGIKNTSHEDQHGDAKAGSSQKGIPETENVLCGNS